jgi:hypothetical protein
MLAVPVVNAFVKQDSAAMCIDMHAIVVVPDFAGSKLLASLSIQT